MKLGDRISVTVEYEVKASYYPPAGAYPGTWEASLERVSSPIPVAMGWRAETQQEAIALMEADLRKEGVL